jgi:hypothetical protein
MGPNTSCDIGVSSVHFCLQARYKSLSKSRRMHRSRLLSGVLTVAAPSRNDAVLSGSSSVGAAEPASGAMRAAHRWVNALREDNGSLASSSERGTSGRSGSRMPLRWHSALYSSGVRRGPASPICHSPIGISHPRLFTGGIGIW